MDTLNRSAIVVQAEASVSRLAPRCGPHESWNRLVRRGSGADGLSHS